MDRLPGFDEYSTMQGHAPRFYEHPLIKRTTGPWYDATTTAYAPNYFLFILLALLAYILWRLMKKKK
jgi:hypothetical protein